MMLRRLPGQIAFFCVRKIAKFYFHYLRIAATYLLRLRGKRSFIVERLEGERSFESGYYAVFIIWQPGGLPWYVRNALEAFAAAKVNVVAVVNHTLTDEMRAELVRSTRYVLVRDNTGFDFGGYQDGTAFIRASFPYERLIYVNDSVYFFRDGLENLFTRLATSKADVCTAFENWEFSYHVQSFCFSVSRHLMDTPDVRAFWLNYLPVSSRLWAIHKGEIGLSAAIAPNARSFDVVYTPNSIRSAVTELAKTDVDVLNTYLPVRIRIPVGSSMNFKVEGEQQLIERLHCYSQIHGAGFLYRKFANSPLMKRDIVWRRDQYSVYDVENCLTVVGHEGHLAEILSDMRRKGKGDLQPLLRRALFCEALI
ncbi:MAG: hypothetical protein KF810_18140 [Rhizobiaceae bacterium]|nr:hypothetical protein [Rhizobiaceae bacterium]